MALYVKLWTDILGDEKLMRAARKGAKHLVLLPWLIVFAKRVDDGGRLTVNGEPAEPEDIAALIPGVSPKQVGSCIDECTVLGVLESDGHGVLRFANWQARTGPSKPSDTAEATRSRKRRSRDGHARDIGVTEEVSRGYARSQELELETELDQEQEPEQDTTPTTPAAESRLMREPQLAERLETDADRAALTAILSRCERKPAFVALCAGILDGDGSGQAVTLRQLGDALQDFAVNGAGDVSARQFRAFVEKAKHPLAVRAERRREGSQGEDDESATTVAAIRALIGRNGRSTFIPRLEVEAMGPRVLAAYNAIGGPDRFLNATPDTLRFLVKDFAQALRTSHAQ